MAFRKCFENINRYNRVTERFFLLKFKIATVHVDSFRKCTISEISPLKTFEQIISTLVKIF